MTCTYRHEPTAQVCGNLARWVVVIDGVPTYLCTIPQAHRDPTGSVARGTAGVTTILISMTAGAALLLVAKQVTGRDWLELVGLMLFVAVARGMWERGWLRP